MSVSGWYIEWVIAQSITIGEILLARLSTTIIIIIIIIIWPPMQTDIFGRNSHVWG
jgi:hypothetical protein